MPPKHSPDTAAFDVLGNPVRREIINLLFERQRSVGELAAELPVSRPAVSRHLRLLEGAGFVASESRGAQNLYRLDSRGFEVARRWLDGFWDEALTRFKLTAENTRPRGKRG